MSFATRADLLARSNARRLAQLAIPADMAMPPDEALRVTIAGGDLAAYSADERTALAAALDAIDKALGDADALIESHGIPAAVRSTLLARLASTIALYYLYDAEKCPREVRDAYDGAVGTLKAHARGELSLTPAAAPATPGDDGGPAVFSTPSRYGRACRPDDEVGL